MLFSAVKVAVARSLEAITIGRIRLTVLTKCPGLFLFYPRHLLTSLCLTSVRHVGVTIQIESSYNVEYVLIKLISLQAGSITSASRLKTDIN